MMKKSYSGYLFFGVFLIIALLAFFVIKPFITSILASIVLAHLFHPIYKILSKKINSSIAALIILIIVILIFILPSIFIAQALFRESITLYNYIQNSNLNPLVNGALNKISEFVSSEASSLITSIPKFLLNVFITLFLFYYFLKEGDKIVNNVKDLLPLEKKHKETMLKEFKRVTSPVFDGVILMGLIVGVIGTIGFYIFHVSNPILWGFILIIVSMLPGLGNAVIWVPASVLKLIQGDYFNGIGLFIYGLLFISGIEVLFKPRLISYKSDMHPALIVLGIFGGITFLGFIGIFFGPLILAIFITFLKHLVHEKFS